MKNKILLPSAITVLLLGCANNYQVSSNLDSKNFTSYFSPAEVRVFENEKALMSPYKNLGLVEGESCQSKAFHELPNEIDARTDARKKAYQLGANAIVFSACTLIDNNTADRHCIRTRVCYGRAFFVEQQAKK